MIELLIIKIYSFEIAKRNNMNVGHTKGTSVHSILIRRHGDVASGCHSELLGCVGGIINVLV